MSVYQFLAQTTSGADKPLADYKGNSQGEVVKRYAPKTTPEEMEHDIQKLLKAEVAHVES